MGNPENLRHVSPEYHEQLRDLAELLCTEEVEYHPAPIVVEDTETGFDVEGNWHCPMRGL